MSRLRHWIARIGLKIGPASFLGRYTTCTGVQSCEATCAVLQYILLSAAIAHWLSNVSATTVVPSTSSTSVQVLYWLRAQP
jgi:hypothetical protein